MTINQMRTLLQEAVRVAEEAEIAVILLDFPMILSQKAMIENICAMPQQQNQLIEAIAAVQPNTIVVLHNGSPVEMPGSAR